MPRANAMVPPEAIRIEDEVWEEAFVRREPARANRRRPLRAIDGGQADWLLEPSTDGAFEQMPASFEPAPVPPLRSSIAGSVAGTSTAPPPPVTAAGAMTSTSLGSTGGPAARSRPTPPVRRTVKIQGRGAERNMPWPDAARRRPPRRAYERTGFRPDRVAMWAVLLGFLLVLVAVASGHG